MAGHDRCQNLYMGAKRAPSHRTPDFVERRQDEVLSHQTLLRLYHE